MDPHGQKGRRPVPTDPYGYGRLKIQEARHKRKEENLRPFIIWD